MEREVFIDTSGFFSLLCDDGNTHKKAKAFMRKAKKLQQRFVTSDYVLDETATLFRARGLPKLSGRALDMVFRSSVVTVEWSNSTLFRDVSAFFLRHNDKQWSFTDCHSFVLMKRLGIGASLTTDRHFEQAGYQALLR